MTGVGGYSAVEFAKAWFEDREKYEYEDKYYTAMMLVGILILSDGLRHLTQLL
ncbi:hypothetical protein [Natrinema sp. DC36]|uniref:hypothetical protein n=1 Tax=Natrinema sp. DC36 TaxID=2878680 RepID=UPI001CF02C38|nr:hypothetical protein [Natrinema sp. DC36]